VCISVINIDAYVHTFHACANLCLCTYLLRLCESEPVRVHACNHYEPVEISNCG
jgi:hypothetical protein